MVCTDGVTKYVHYGTQFALISYKMFEKSHTQVVTTISVVAQCASALIPIIMSKAQVTYIINVF